MSEEVFSAFLFVGIICAILWNTTKSKSTKTVVEIIFLVMVLASLLAVLTFLVEGMSTNEPPEGYYWHWEYNYLRLVPVPEHWK